MKKWFGACLFAMLLAVVLCGSALAETNIYDNKVPKNRISVSFPKGVEIKSDVIEDGKISICIDDDWTEWNKVFEESGSFPFIHASLEITPPAGYTQYKATNGDLRVQDLDKILAHIEEDNIHTGNWHQMQDFAEIDPDGQMIIPRSYETKEDGDGVICAYGTLICWSNANGEEYYEYLVIEITHTAKPGQSFPVELEFLPESVLAANNSSTLPSHVTVTELEDGKITFKVGDDSDYSMSHFQMRFQVPTELREQVMGAQLITKRGETMELWFSDGCVTGLDVRCKDLTNVDEQSYVLQWLDMDGVVVGYGLFRVYVTPAVLKPWMAYADWNAMDKGRMTISNDAEKFNITTTYEPDGLKGVLRLGFNGETNIKPSVDALKDVVVKVEPYPGAKYYKWYGGGGSGFYGADEKKVENCEAEIARETAVSCENGEAVTVIERQPMREYKLARVNKSVFVQSMPYTEFGGDERVFFWYESLADVEANNPLCVEYFGMIYQPLSMKKFGHTHGNVNEPVTEVTLVTESDAQVMLEVPLQSGDNAECVDISVEKGARSGGEMEFYMPYPDGHEAGNTQYLYELYHYNSDYSESDEVEITPDEYGIHFTVNSLSPFVLSWELLVDAIQLPDNLKEIGEEAFTGVATKAFVLPEGVTTIGPKAFANCKALEAINLPASLNSIADDIFEGCDLEKLTVTVDANTPAFDWCQKNTNIQYTIATE